MVKRIILSEEEKKEELKHLVRSRFYGSLLMDFVRKSPGKYVESCKAGLINYFVNEGTLVKETTRWEDMTQEERIETIRRMYGGLSLKAVRATPGGKGVITTIGRYKLMPELIARGVLKKTRPKYDYAGRNVSDVIKENHMGKTLRQIKKEDGSLLNRAYYCNVVKSLVDEGVIVRENLSWAGMSNEDFIDYVKANYYGSRIENIKNLRVYRQLRIRGLLGILVAEGVIMMGTRGRKPKHNLEEFADYDSKPEAKKEEVPSLLFPGM